MAGQGMLSGANTRHLQSRLMCHGGQGLSEPTPTQSTAAAPMECRQLPGLVGIWDVAGQGQGCLSVGGGGELEHTLTRALDPTLQQQR